MLWITTAFVTRYQWKAALSRNEKMCGSLAHVETLYIYISVSLLVYNPVILSPHARSLSQGQAAGMEIQQGRQSARKKMTLFDQSLLYIYIFSKNTLKNRSKLVTKFQLANEVTTKAQESNE